MAVSSELHILKVLGRCCHADLPQRACPRGTPGRPQGRGMRPRGARALHKGAGHLVQASTALGRKLEVARHHSLDRK